MRRESWLLICKVINMLNEMFMCSNEERKNIRATGFPSEKKRQKPSGRNIERERQRAVYSQRERGTDIVGEGAGGGYSRARNRNTPRRRITDRPSRYSRRERETYILGSVKNSIQSF